MGKVRVFCFALSLNIQELVGRFGPHNSFHPSEDYTRLTFDTIALCSMNVRYVRGDPFITGSIFLNRCLSLRFNSFYERDMPPFTKAMVDVLIESSNRVFRPSFSQYVPLVYKAANEKYERDIKFMKDSAYESEFGSITLQSFLSVLSSIR